MRDSYTKKTFKDHKMSPTHKFNHKMFDCCQKIQIKQTVEKTTKNRLNERKRRRVSLVPTHLQDVQHHPGFALARRGIRHSQKRQDHR